MRKPQGSATEFNRQIGAGLGEIPIVAEAMSAVRSGGLTIPLAVRDRLQRAWLGRNTETLADLLSRQIASAAFGAWSSAAPSVSFRARWRGCSCKAASRGRIPRRSKVLLGLAFGVGGMLGRVLIAFRIGASG